MPPCRLVDRADQRVVVAAGRQRQPGLRWSGWRSQPGARRRGDSGSAVQVDRRRRSRWPRRCAARRRSGRRRRRRRPRRGRAAPRAGRRAARAGDSARARRRRDRRSRRAPPSGPASRRRSPRRPPARRLASRRTAAPPAPPAPSRARWRRPSSGPGVETVSPPSRATPNASPSSARPRRRPRARRQPRYGGQAVDRSVAEGLGGLGGEIGEVGAQQPPGDDRRRPRRRKCTPSTMASLEITRSKPGRAGRTAASSIRPSAAGVAARQRPQRGRSSRTRQAAPLIAGDGVQGGVDEAGLGALEEGLGDLDIFVDHHLGRARRRGDQLEGAGAQDRRARWRRSAPAASRRPGGGAIGPVDSRLVARPRRAPARRRRPRRRGASVSPSMSRSKRWSANSRITASAPRRRSPSDRAPARRPAGPPSAPGAPRPASPRPARAGGACSAIIARQARPRRRPCRPRRARARAQAWASSSTVRMPLPIARRRPIARSIRPRADFVGHDLEMIGLAADHAAQRDIAVVAHAGRPVAALLGHARWRPGSPARRAR